VVRRFTVLALFLSLLASGIPSASASSERVGRYIVVLDPSVGHPGAVASEHAREHGAQVRFVYRHALKGYAAAIPENRLAAVRADDRVTRVDADASVQAFSHPVGNAPTGVHRAFAPNNPEITIDGVDDYRVNADIAIIDTGIDIDHPDLNVEGGKNCQNGNSYDDGNGHGTHVAGTAAGLDNGAGVVGMAPGARLWAVRVLNNAGSGSWSSVVCGVDWVTGRNTDADFTNNIEVANMSLGGSGSDGPCGSSSLHLAICNSVTAGVTYAVAAGNSADDAANHVPAAYDQVITVSALADFNGEAGGLGSPTCRTDVDDTFANFSNYGADVDLIAPGVCIRSAWKGGGYNTISGTSMASPHVAGAAALYKATNAGATPAQVQSALRTAGNLGWTWPSEDKDSTQEPLLDVSSATVFNPALVAGASSPSPPSDNDPPTVTSISPANGSTVSGTAVGLAATASDSDGNVATVDFYVDDVWLDTDSDGADGWTATWNLESVTDGPYTLRAVATDDDGATGSHSVGVTVDNADPPPGSTLSVEVAASQSTKKGPWYHVSLTVTVTDGTATVSGATVAMEVLDGACPGGGAPSSGSGRTDGNGTVTFTFKTRSQATYCAAATSTKDGYTDGAGSATFTT